MKDLYKNIFFLTILLLFVFHLRAQNAYYYYKDTKINLYTDSSSIVLIFKSNYTDLNRVNRFLRDTTIINLDASDGSEDLEFARITYDYSVHNIANKIQQYGIDTNNLEAYSYGYVSSDSSHLYPWNEVLTKLNENCNQQEIDSIINNYNTLSTDTSKWGLISIKTNKINEAFQLSNDLYKSGNVTFATPDFTRNYIGTNNYNNNTLYKDQYYLNNTGQVIDGNAGIADMDIDAPKAWDINYGNSSIRVAVIGHGVELDHEDMLGRVINGYTPGCLFGCHGKPAGNPHGTAVAGIIAANNNNKGIIGVASGVTIVPFRIFKRSGSIKSDRKIASAVNKAWDDFNCDIINLSVKGASSPAVNTAINHAAAKGRNHLGCVIVCSAGNDNSSVNYPAYLNNTIAVSAVDKFGQITSYSNFGTQIDVAAFGGGDDANDSTDIRTIDIT